MTKFKFGGLEFSIYILETNKKNHNFKFFKLFERNIFSRVMLPTLDPQSSASHTCNVVFFTPGQYKIDIQCSAPECLSNVPVAPSIIGNSHVWRFIPPVEVTVNE